MDVAPGRVVDSGSQGTGDVGMRSQRVTTCCLPRSPGPEGLCWPGPLPKAPWRVVCSGLWKEAG